MTQPDPSRRSPALRLLHPAPLFAAAGLLLALGLLLFPPAPFTPAESRAAALAVAAIGFWATGALPEHLTSLLFFLFAMLFAVAPPTVVFSGFTSAALWLIFAGLVIGVAVRSTGLGERIARHVARTLDRSYFMLIGGLVALGVMFGFLMPSSMGRVILLVPIALAVADHFGFAPGSNGRTGVVLAAAFGTHVPTFAILPANVPNMVLVGASESIYSISPLYGEYFWLHFPVLGLLKSVVLVLLVVWLFPDRPRATGQEAPLIRPVTRDEKKLAWILAIALVLWMTDAIHHISPAWVALGAAALLMLPGFGMITAQQFNRDINYGSMFFVAGIMGLGAMVSQSGLGDWLAHGLLSVIPLRPGHTAVNFSALAFTSLMTGVVTTLPGVPAVLTPLAGKMALATGLPLRSVLMSQVLGFSTTLLPYQSAPLVVGVQLADERLASAAKLCVALAVITIAVLWPLDYLWWHLTGWL